MLECLWTCGGLGCAAGVDPLYLLGLRTEVGAVDEEDRFLERFFCTPVDSLDISFSFCGEVEGFGFFDAGELVGDVSPVCSVGKGLSPSKRGLLISEISLFMSLDSS